LGKQKLLFFSDALSDPLWLKLSFIIGLPFYSLLALCLLSFSGVDDEELDDRSQQKISGTLGN